MIKPLVVVVIGLVILAAIVAVYFWYAISQPLYKPGMVRTEQRLRSPLSPLTQPADGTFWKVEDEILLHYFDTGEGRIVLMLHGGPGAPFEDPWPGLEPLEGRHRFYYYHQRGVGLSSKPIDHFESSNRYRDFQHLDQSLGLGAQIADIERIRQILGEDRLILIGHSFGAFLASLYAAEFPEHIDGLVLIAPADVLVFPQPAGGAFEAIRSRLPTEQRAAFDAYIEDYLDFSGIFEKSDEELAELNAGFLAYYASAMDQTIEPETETAGWAVQAVYLSMGKRHDYRPALKAVDAPVLVIHGADDLQSKEQTQIYVEAFPDAELLVIEGSTHFPFVEQPEVFSAAVGRFLEQIQSQ